MSAAPAPAVATPADYDPPLQACVLCGASALRPDLVDHRGHHIVRCAACGVRFMNPQYSDGYLARYYAGYINLHPEPGREQRFRMSLPVRSAGKRRALQLLSRHATGQRLLLVGCGDGLELGIAKELGWTVSGYDVDPAITAELARSHGVPVHAGSFHALAQRPERYDAVYLDQVIEHPKDPGAYLRTCRELLVPGGVLYLGTPNLGSLSCRMKSLADRLHLRKKIGKHLNTSHHLTFFTPGVLVGHLRRLGFTPLCVRGSLKPQRNPLSAWLGALSPVFDSSFLVIARRGS